MDVGQFDIQKTDGQQILPPLWAQPDFKSPKAIAKWFSNVQPNLEKLHENRIRRMNTNLGWYCNEFGTGARMIIGSRNVAIPVEQLGVLVGHIYDLTEQRVSRLASYKPAFDVAPTHNEESDRITARLMKPILDAVARNNNLDFLIQEIQRWASVFGEVFAGVDWDKSMGDKDEKGNFIGDVRIYTKEPFFVFYEPKVDWRKVSFITEIDEIIHVEEARKKFNLPELKPEGINTLYSFSVDDDGMKAADEVVVYRIIYKPSVYLPNGLVCRVIGKHVVEIQTEKYPWSHNDFPYERHTDIDVPGRVFPMSFYNYLIPMQSTYNKLTALINRNIMLTAHPKWMAQKGSVDMKALGNTAGIALYNPGAPKPELMTFNSVNQDTYTFRSDMRSEMQTVSGIQGVSRGSPPAGARAASMLKFYEEQEVQRSSTIIGKHNTLIRKILTKAGGVVGDHYPEQPNRLIRVVGKQNRYKILRLTQEKISSNYDVIIQNSTGFSESKSGRIEEIGFFQQNLPGFLKPAQIADILEIAQPQKAYDITTGALNNAEEENSDFVDGLSVGAPIVSDDHVTHWDTHLVFMQSESFKRLPKRYQDGLINHVKVHEMFMEHMREKSPMIAQQIDSLPNFPVFWTKAEEPPAPVAPPMPPAPPGIPNGAMQPLQDPAALPPMPQDPGAGTEMGMPQPLTQ